MSCVLDESGEVREKLVLWDEANFLVMWVWELLKRLNVSYESQSPVESQTDILLACRREDRECG